MSENKKKPAATRLLPVRMMVPAIDGYNNTIKSEMEPPCPASGPSPHPGIQRLCESRGRPDDSACAEWVSAPRRVSRAWHIGYSGQGTGVLRGHITVAMSPLNHDSYSTGRGITGRSHRITGNYTRRAQDKPVRGSRVVRRPPPVIALSRGGNRYRWRDPHRALPELPVVSGSTLVAGKGSDHRGDQ